VQQDSFPDASESGEDDAAVGQVAAGWLDDPGGGFDLGVAADQGGWPQARAGAVWVENGIHDSPRLLKSRFV